MTEVAVSPEMKQAIRQLVREELDGSQDPAARRRLLTTQETARFLALDVRSIRRLADRGALPFVRVGSRKNFALEDLIAFQRRNAGVVGPVVEAGGVHLARPPV